jgi:formylglycine-generating enzyme required for sulfatase activity
VHLAALNIKGSGIFAVKGSTCTFTRVVRGGSWNNNPNNCRVSVRNRNNPNNRNNNMGFRVARRRSIGARILQG